MSQPLSHCKANRICHFNCHSSSEWWPSQPNIYTCMMTLAFNSSRSHTGTNNLIETITTWKLTVWEDIYLIIRSIPFPVLLQQQAELTAHRSSVFFQAEGSLEGLVVKRSRASRNMIQRLRGGNTNSRLDLQLITCSTSLVPKTTSGGPRPPLADWKDSAWY